jgi:hypothetical protein
LVEEQARRAGLKLVSENAEVDDGLGGGGGNQGNPSGGTR